MKLTGEYLNKLCSPEKAVKVIKSGDWLDYGMAVNMPTLLDAALAERCEQLKDVKIRGNMAFGPLQVVESDPMQEHFIYNSWHCSSYERALCDRGLCYYIPMIYRNCAEYYRHFLTVNVAMIAVAPMDSGGYFNLSCCAGILKPIIDKAEVVILEVNEHLPRIQGGAETRVHISEVDMIVEGEHAPLPQLPLPSRSKESESIAKLILPHIVDGAVLQLGIGSVPSLLGQMVAESGLKDLSMHTELCSDCYVDMDEAGVITNRMNTAHRGVGVFGLALGTQRLYDWLENNLDVAVAPISYVNSPSVMAHMDNMVSINGCIAADLYGQVCAESSGLRHISGTGGQLDFLTGAADSKGGKAFICMTSTYRDKRGELHSRILPHFSGDIITSPRSQAHYIATEYGAVNLAGRSTWERAELMISIAHPDFRQELIRAAEAQKIWRSSEKI